MKRNNLFERLLVLSCEACEVPVAKAMRKSRSADAVDCRLIAVDFMLKYGLSDVFIASMFSRTRTILVKKRFGSILIDIKGN